MTAAESDLAEELFLALPGNGDGLVAQAVLDSPLARVHIRAQLLRVRLARCVQVSIRPVVLRCLDNVSDPPVRAAVTRRHSHP